jgi:hypothetical protein
MRWKRSLLRALLAILIIFDLLAALQFRRHGWPVRLTGEPIGDGAAHITVTYLPFSPADGALVCLLIAIQGAVVYFNWRDKGLRKKLP